MVKRRGCMGAWTGDSGQAGVRIRMETGPGVFFSAVSVTTETRLKKQAPFGV